jgi:DNA-binding CsgD family transcriptional regulator
MKPRGLWTSGRGVGGHNLHHIYEKLHVESRVEAVMKYVQDQSAKGKT